MRFRAICNSSFIKILFGVGICVLVLKYLAGTNMSNAGIKKAFEAASKAKSSLSDIFSNFNSDSVNGMYYSDAKYFPSEPIDLVYTWVNGTDPIFEEQLAFYKHDKSQKTLQKNRYIDNNELLYSLRSVEKFAPWIRHIYIVTNGQIPSWLNLENSRISIVDHKDICPPELIEQALPTFSSMAIEMMLHRIPNLSQRFIYLNDDIFLGRPLYLDDLRSEHNGIYVLRAWDIEYCAETCLWKMIGNRKCEAGCNIASCNFDGNDCDPFPLEKMFANGTSIEDMKGAKPEVMPSRLVLKDSTVNNDHYLTSLIHTHSLLVQRYGYTKRKTIAHAGFLIDRNVMKDIEIIFPKDFRNTQIHQFRHGSDSLQFALVYHEVLLNEKRIKSIKEIFNDFDMDKSGVWSEMEIRYFLVRLHQTNVLKWKHVQSFCETIRKCMHVAGANVPHSDTQINETDSETEYPERKLGCSWNGIWDIIDLSLDDILDCKNLTTNMLKRFGSVRKYKASTHPNPTSIYTFNRISNDTDQAKQVFDQLLHGVHLFNCLNNDIVSDDPSYFDSDEYKQLIAQWQKFYFYYFPIPSEFELSHNMRNRFTYIDEYRAWQMAQKRLQFLVFSGLMVSLLIIVAFSYYQMYKRVGVSYKLLPKSSSPQTAI